MWFFFRELTAIEYRTVVARRGVVKEEMHTQLLPLMN